MSSYRDERIIKSIEKIPHKIFVMHGSRRRRSILIPGMPNQSAPRKENRKKGVYGTCAMVIAVAYAVLGNNLKWKYVIGKGLQLLCPPEGLPTHCGYIHICSWKDFRGNVLVARSNKPVKVLRIIKVNPEVLEILYKRKEFRIVAAFDND